MAIAKGVAKRVAYKKETTWGQLAGASGGQQLRRVTATFNLTKDSYESNEIRTDYQVADMRHGIRSVEGSLNGELSPSSYSDFMSSILARNFTAVTSIAGVSVTVAASGSFFTITRAAGDWIADGVHVGNVVRLTGAGLSVNNVNNNILVAGMSATVLTVISLSGTPLVAEGPITSVTVTVPGMVTYAPQTGHTDDSYTVEEYYADIGQSETYTGLKVGSMAVQLPSTGLVTCDFSFMGKNLDRADTTPYFTAPATAGTDGIFASVSGALLVEGVPRALITSMDFTVDRGLEAATVVGSNFNADVFTGRIRVTGNMSTYFEDSTFRDYFDDEAKVSVVVALATGEEKNAEVVTFSMPIVKLGSDGKSDGEMGVTRDHSFTALLNTNTTAGLVASTLMIQDTSL
jgi:hypothetical protein